MDERWRHKVRTRNHFEACGDGILERQTLENAVESDKAAKAKACLVAYSILERLVYGKTSTS